MGHYSPGRFHFNDILLSKEQTKCLSMEIELKEHRCMLRQVKRMSARSNVCIFEISFFFTHCDDGVDID